jgi:hypothetical protein
MDPPPEAWMARSAVALCVASRWLSGAALVLAALALSVAQVLPAERIAAAAGLAVAAAAGAVQVYLALRIEFDRQIFQALAGAGEPGEAVKGFDQAMRALGMMPEHKTGRALADRVRGLRSLVRSAGWLFAFQLALSLAVPWMR